MVTTTDPVIHVGNTHTFEVVFLDDAGAVLDISSATTREIHLRKPDGTALQKTASFVTDGTDGAIEYKALTTDIDAEGNWKVQGKVVTATDTWTTRVDEFPVAANIL